MSKARPYDRDSLERALVHHGVRHHLPEDPPLGIDGRQRRGKWWIDVDGGRNLTDREVYAFLVGFKLAKDRAHDLARLVREFQIHDLNDYGRWTRGMHDRANEALEWHGYKPLERGPVRTGP